MVESLAVYRAEVMPEWIDYNGHLTVSAYLMLFSKAADKFFLHIGIDEQYRRERLCAPYAAESHIKFLHECFTGDPILIEAQILNHDDKRIHLFQRMRNRDTGIALAVEESMHSNLVHAKTSPNSLGVTPFNRGVLARLEALMKQHEKISWPAEVGAVIQLPLQRPH